MKKASSPLAQAALDYEVVERALALPPVERVLSPAIELVFQRWAGKSGADFFQSLTKETVMLRQSHDSAGAGDLELDITCEAIKPGQPASGTIRYGTYPTPFGKALIALSHHGICELGFDVAELSAKWQGAELKEDKKAVAAICERIFTGGSDPVPVHLRGTQFQISVWLALLSLPMGSLITYQGVARQMGRPEATRAVATAIARNGICYLVPCHRVIQGNGAIGQYRWGASRKQAMIGWEGSRVEGAPLVS